MNEIIICLVACLVARFYASLSGIKDGILYGRQGADTFSWNEHIVYVLERITFGGIFFCGFFLDSYLSTIIVSINIVIGFSFWHNGLYYLTRGKITGTWDRFNSNSTSSTAVIELRWRTRKLLEIISWILFLLYFSYIYNL